MSIFNRLKGHETQSDKQNRLPKVYWAYLLLLIFTLALFLYLSLCGRDLSYSFELKKMDLSHYAAPQTETDVVIDSVEADTIAIASTWADSVQRGIDAAENTACAKVFRYDYLTDSSSSDSVLFLLIGDSMNEFLRLRLNDYCKANGHKMNCVIWYGATTKQYGTCDTIAYFIRKFHPTYVLLTIGANELFVRDIVKKRTPYVRHIVAQLGNIPYVWVGPPNWKDDTGINDMIVSHVGESRYFESRKLTFNRCSDGAHPTKSSAFLWMDEIATYLASDAQHTVVMNKPDAAYGKVPQTTILKMVRE